MKVKKATLEPLATVRTIDRTKPNSHVVLEFGRAFVSTELGLSCVRGCVVCLCILCRHIVYSKFIYQV